MALVTNTWPNKEQEVCDVQAFFERRIPVCFTNTRDSGRHVASPAQQMCCIACTPRPVRGQIQPNLFINSIGSLCEDDLGPADSSDWEKLSCLLGKIMFRAECHLFVLHDQLLKHGNHLTCPTLRQKIITTRSKDLKPKPLWARCAV